MVRAVNARQDGNQASDLVIRQLAATIGLTLEQNERAGTWHNSQTS